MVNAEKTRNEPAARRLPAARVATLVLIAAAVVIFNQSAIHWRDNVNDSHYYAYCGWRVSQGARPYLDVWDNKPPGTWWLNALGCWICGPGLPSDLLICSAALAIALLGFVAVARTVYHRSLWLPALLTACVLLTHVRYECGANRTETFVVPCEILAVLGYLRWRRSGRWSWLILGGLFAGAAPLFKQSGMAAAGACALHLLWSQLTRRRASAGATASRRGWLPWLVAGGAFITLPALAAIVLALQGALSEARFAIWEFNHAYFDVHDATWLHLRGPFARYLPELPPLYGVGLVAAFGAVLALAGRSRRLKSLGFSTPDRAGLSVFWLWLLVAFYLACVGPGRLAYHLAPTLAPLGLLALYPLDWLIRGRELDRRIVARPSIAALLVAYIYVLGLAGSDSVAMARRGWAVKPHWYALQRTEPAPYEIQAAAIARLTRPEDTIYVWGWSPGTYRFAYRHAASRFATVEKVGQVGEHARFIVEAAMADIRRAPPRVIAVSTGDLAAWRAPPRSDFAQWVVKTYDDLGDFEGMHILLRRE
jgi:4-amino-4-deoxy-L-arabinose transferase-like glycosyltransferase